MPISEKQLEANRANAQLSTGPKTPEGKARSAMNGFQSPLTGLTTVMAEEDRLAQWEFTEAYIADLAPVGAIEEQLANVLANDNWRLNRLKAVEENIFAWGYEPTSGPRVTCAIEKVQTAGTLLKQRP